MIPIPKTRVTIINHILNTRTESVYPRPAFDLMAEHPELDLAREWLATACETDDIQVVIHVTDADISESAITVLWYAETDDDETARAWMADVLSEQWREKGGRAI